MTNEQAPVQPRHRGGGPQRVPARPRLAGPAARRHRRRPARRHRSIAERRRRLIPQRRTDVRLTDAGMLYQYHWSYTAGNKWQQ